jgi:Ca2+/Na+ antiporter
MEAGAASAFLVRKKNATGCAAIKKEGAFFLFFFFILFIFLFCFFIFLFILFIFLFYFFYFIYFFIRYAASRRVGTGCYPPVG